MQTTSKPALRSNEAAAPETAAPRTRIAFVDGLRGLAALYVALNHVLVDVAKSPTVADPMQYSTAALAWLKFGHYAVVFFLVISGFCLMMPVLRKTGTAADQDQTIRHYFARRAARILPPYYAALALSLAVLYLPGITKVAGTYVLTREPFSFGCLISHLFLLHNINPSWIAEINNPLWSISTEWEIYLLFPLLLLPLWRRFGNIATILSSLALSVGAYMVSDKALQVAAPWLIANFAMGMFAADLCFGNKLTLKKFYDRIPFGTIAALTGALVIALNLTHQARYIAMDILVGCSAASLLVCLVRAQRIKPGNLLLRALEYKPLLALGAISYSLYLIHVPVLGSMHVALYGLGWTPQTILIALFAMGIPASIAAASLFARLFEFPFQSKLSPAGGGGGDDAPGGALVRPEMAQSRSAHHSK